MKIDQKMMRQVGKILGILLSVAVMAGLYFTLVMVQPVEAAGNPMETQAPWPGAPGEKISAESELRQLVQGFPGPVMSFMSGSGMAFVSGEAQDAASGGKMARVLSLYWQTPEGQPLMLQSIYPAETLWLMAGEDYHFAAQAGPTLFGLPSVAMENQETLRIHVQVQGEGLYVLLVPKALAPEVFEISRSIQLFTAE